MSDPLFEITKALEDAQASLQKAHLLLNSLPNDAVSPIVRERMTDCSDEEAKQVIEGVFDGLQMIGPDGQTYPVPANYASKSKLVEGDLLKLRVTPTGAMIFKQIGPVARKRIKGLLMRGEAEGDFRVLSKGRSYKVLGASVTYYKGQEGDRATLLIPEGGESRWGAIEMISNTETGDNAEEEMIEIEPRELPIDDELDDVGEQETIEEQDLFDDLEYQE